MEYGNVLEAGYTLPGYLAAGVSGQVTLTFTPKANEDIETQVRVLVSGVKKQSQPSQSKPS